MPYPPPPWRLIGPCAVVTGMIPVDRLAKELACFTRSFGATTAATVTAGELHLTFDDIRILAPPAAAPPADGQPAGRST